MLQSIAARRLRCRAGSRRRAPTARAPRLDHPLARAGRGAGAGRSTRSAAAASSMASGMPSRRRQISATSAALAGVDLEVRPHGARTLQEQLRGRAGEQRPRDGLVGRRLGGDGAAARSTRRARAARRARPGSWPGSSGPGSGRWRSASAGAAARTCSTVSRTSSVGAGRRARPTSASATDAPGSSPTPSAPAIAGQHHRGVADGVERARWRPGPRHATTSDAASSAARRLFPTPPTPTSVMNAGSGSRGERAERGEVAVAADQRTWTARTAPRRATGARRRSRRRAASAATVGRRIGRGMASMGCPGYDASGRGLRTMRRPSLAVGCLELPGIRREPEPHVAGQDPAVAEPRDRAAARRLAGQRAAAAAGPRRSPSSRRRTSAGPGRRSAGSGRARASTPGAPGPRAGRSGRRARSRATKNGSVGSVERPPAVSTTSTAPRPAASARRSACSTVVRLVGARTRSAAIVEPSGLDLVPDAPLEPLAVRRAERLLHDDPDPHRDERRDPHQRPGAVRARPPPRRRSTASGTTWGATLTDATSCPGATTDPSSAVNTSSGSIRSSRSTSRDADVRARPARPRRGRPGSRSGRGLLEPRARGRPRRGGAPPRPRGASPGSRTSTVSVPRPAGAAAPTRRQVVRPSAAGPSASARPADREVAREHGPGEARAAACDPARSARAAPVRRPDRRLSRRGASAVSIARRVYTTAIAAR